MSKVFTAQEIHTLVTDVFASGRPNWPVSRSSLQGLSLRQVKDAIKIHVTLVYLKCLNGDAPLFVYEGLKKHWTTLFQLLPAAFVRDEIWKEFEHLPPEERHLALLGSGAGYAIDREIMNEEELEFFENETFESFIVYLEKVCKYSEHPLDHVLGHLSQGYIYYDDTIAVFETR